MRLMGFTFIGRSLKISFILPMRTKKEIIIYARNSRNRVIDVIFVCKSTRAMMKLKKKMVIHKITEHKTSLCNQA